MVYWQPGTQYNLGDVVTYEGADYKIIQPHRSQGDWTPPVTPALWGRMQSGGGHNYGYGNSDCQPDSKPHESHCPPPPPQQPYQQQQPHQAPPPQYTYGNNDQNYNQQAPPPAKSDDKDSDDEGSSKKKWAIGGGIAAGAALLGAGIAAYKHHEKKEDKEEEAQWIALARSRTDAFYSQGPRGPYTWVLNQGKNIPQGAIVVGKEHSWTLYICRAFHKGSVTPGKASDVFQKGAVIGYGHDEIHKDTYEILLGDMNALRWVPTSGKLNISSLGYRPVDGGKDSDGTILYVVRAQHKGCYHPGKASERLKGAFIPYDGGEKEVNDYEVLCVNH